MNIQGKPYPYQKLICVFLIILCSTNFLFAQNTVHVTGRVVDEQNEPIIGATILIKGTSIGTVTDLDGNFKVAVNDLNKDVLTISYMGYETMEVRIQGKSRLTITLKELSKELDEVTVVAYGVQKKETLTGAISSVNTADLLQSPNASIANSLAGKITGLSSVQSSGQPGAEDPKIFIRGVGALTEGGASPLILVDGVERGFFQMDPNEIENVTVLKDASATAVFGVRGANGVILVTTRRGKEGRAKISVNSSVGAQMPTRMLQTADSYTYAMTYNKMLQNDGMPAEFDEFALNHFKLGDEPILYPNTNWRKYMTNDAAIQTQHNMNISGGTDAVRYFISVGYLYQDGLFKDFGQKDLGYSYNRYNYRTNLDIDITKSTTLKLGIGGVVGDKMEPTNNNDLWRYINWSQPFSSPGIIDGKMVTSNPRYDRILQENPMGRYYGKGYDQSVANTMNLDVHLVQNIDFVTKGLSVEIKGAYNTDYTFIKRREGNVENYTAFFKSELDGLGLSQDNPEFNKDIVYRISGTNSKLSYNESTNRGRDWYFEGSVRYDRKFGDHNFGGLLLYNQNKKYYPKQLGFIPTAYIGFVGRVTYDYKSKYMAEFNVGYNGSENFVPDQRFGTFPALSLGYNISEEEFMKNQNVFEFLKVRASVGLVGNDNMSDNRFLYLPDSYNVDMQAADGTWKNNKWGYNFGLQNSTLLMGSVENRIGNPNVTWETALKQNYGVDMHFLDNRLKINLDLFREDRKDILISRKTIPGLTGLSTSLLPVVNMGEVENKGYEVEIGWNDKIGKDFDYYVNANVSYSKNKIVFQDEIEPNEVYLWRTGQPVGSVFGYVAKGFYREDDFINDELKDQFAKPQVAVHPGDVKYEDLNGDGVINSDDQKNIGYSTRPNYVFGLNLGASYKRFFFSMNWAGAAERSLVLADAFRRPFNSESRGLLQYHADNYWTPETATKATQPRLSKNSSPHNYMTSTLWVKNGSYLKLKNLTLGYNFKGYEGLRKMGINQLGIKITGYNLLTFDHFGIMDPESNPGAYGDSYPVVKIINLGVNLTF